MYWRNTKKFMIHLLSCYERLRKAGQPLSIGIVQLIFHGMIESTTSKILQKGPRQFIVTRKGTH
jgi:hypothetical protein